MQIKYENPEPGITNLTISGSVSIDDIQELKQAIELRLNNTKGLCLTLTELEYFDMSLLQLLAMSAVQAKKQEKKIDFNFIVDEDANKLIVQTGLDEAYLVSLIT